MLPPQSRRTRSPRRVTPKRLQRQLDAEESDREERDEGEDPPLREEMDEPLEGEDGQ